MLRVRRLLFFCVATLVSWLPSCTNAEVVGTEQVAKAAPHMPSEHRKAVRVRDTFKSICEAYPGATYFENKKVFTLSITTLEGSRERLRVNFEAGPFGGYAVDVVGRPSLSKLIISSASKGDPLNFCVKSPPPDSFKSGVVFGAERLVATPTEHDAADNTKKRKITQPDDYDQWPTFINGIAVTTFQGREEVIVNLGATHIGHSEAVKFDPYLRQALFESLLVSLNSKTRKGTATIDEQVTRLYGWSPELDN